MDISDIKHILLEQGRAFEEFKATQQREFDSMAAKVNRPNFGGGYELAKRLPQYFNVKTQRAVPVLGSTDLLGDLEKKVDNLPSMGRVLRGLVLGSHAPDARELEEERKSLAISADPSGGYTVAGALSSQWIGALRSAMVLNRVGVTTIPMDTSSLTLAKVTGDPTSSWHGENADITATDSTFGAVNLNAKTIVCLVKLSLELSQDSANIEEILQNTIVASMAHAIDAAGLVGVTTNAAASPAGGAGIFGLTGRNSVTGIGAPTSWDWALDSVYELLADDVPMEAIGGMIAHPALWKKMSKLKTGIASDNTPLMIPAEIARMPKFWTTAAPFTGGNTAKAVIGDWRDLLFGVRKDITLQVLRESFMGSNLQIAILAYARCDFAATRASSFVTAEGITV